ncbi:hypothetical protein BJD12_08700 [Xanthomonas vesicatoria ATCC 35937]|uniref:Uncharacterized protein n=1 Tax=Xanthomonas vesicatoria ATCC 35937 TaxID=925775 RepID=F0BCV5_9XANT|nr:hypothetical protein BI313_11525 [Xanthomonas vesicatoria]APP75313.1 hypothetical protein BJD12_08700 [Xanthomonas vesicatoria ATCC 35937]EGD09694.1 hypothetical protein XVE_1934 [Xanthomonas vesicatoria ATCC 35937]KHM98468.1 hypothetical protein OR60_00150 [Xanthomonas vesicatoria]KTF30869.1 hypothetical protein LMG920_18135 [Xanthomonas vesicatoria]
MKRIGARAPLDARHAQDSVIANIALPDVAAVLHALNGTGHCAPHPPATPPADATVTRLAAGL